MQLELQEDWQLVTVEKSPFGLSLPFRPEGEIYLRLNFVN